MPPRNPVAAPAAAPGGGLRRAVGYTTYLIGATGLILLLIEAALRLLCGLPHGWFYFEPLGGEHLYRPDATLRMVMGPFPYTVRTNRLGLRGPDIAVPKPPGISRLVCLGDSVTDGFYVDNEETYPAQLEAALREREQRVEVVNVARGGASIDKEYELLRKFGMPLEPDVVVLTFVTNDIDDLRGKPREALVSLETPEFEPDAASEWLLFARTAVGELILDASMRARYPQYRRYQRGGADAAEIPGARDFAGNVRVFLEQHVRHVDGILGYCEFSDAQRMLVENYLYALEHMHRYCADAGTRLVFVYFPGYNQVHDTAAPMLLRDMLEAGCAARAIPFCDLTPALRAQAGKTVMHFAPVDFHPNAEGNRVMAGAVAECLTGQGLIE